MSGKNTGQINDNILDKRKKQSGDAGGQRSGGSPLKKSQSGKEAMKLGSGNWKTILFISLGIILCSTGEILLVLLGYLLPRLGNSRQKAL